MIYMGKCECGWIEILLQSALDPSQFQPRSDAATCRFCRENDGVWISDASGTLTLPAGERTIIETFASGQVQFHFCSECGDLAYAAFEDTPGEVSVAVVRVALFESIRTAVPPTVITNFEGETLPVGRRRRLEKWTPVQRC